MRSFISQVAAALLYYIYQNCMSYRLRHPEFNSALGVPLDYNIHGFGGWDCVSGVYSPGVGPKVSAFQVIKKGAALQYPFFLIIHATQVT